MFNCIEVKPFLSIAGIVTISGLLLLAPLQAADENPFTMDPLSSGYMVADGHKKQGKHDKMKMMDADGNGSISKDEFIAHAHMKFAKKDKNGDGVLTADEMKKGCGGHGKGKHGKEQSSS